MALTNASAPAPVTPIEYAGTFTVDGVTFDFIAEVWPAGYGHLSEHRTFPVPAIGGWEASWRVVSRSTGEVAYPDAGPPSAGPRLFFP